MNLFGNLNMLENEVQRAALQLETSTPDTIVAGRLLFRNKKVYIAAEIVMGAAVWVQLTNEIDTHIHRQTTAATTWSIAHNLNSTTCSVGVYDQASGAMIIPDEITIVDANNITITVSSAIAGKAVVMNGEELGEFVPPPAVPPATFNATWDPATAQATLSNGNLTASTNDTNWQGARGTVSKSSGKYYFEVLLGIPAGNTATGLVNAAYSLGANQAIGQSAGAIGWRETSTGDVYKNGSIVGNLGTAVNNDRISVAVDFTNLKIWFAKNGTWLGGGDPATNTAGFTIDADTFYPGVTVHNTASQTVNFGASAFTYTVPAGFTAGWSD